MHFAIHTPVEQSPEKVIKGFDDKLFIALKPPLLPMRLRRFDGCERGDEVHLEVGPNWMSQRWEALIIDHDNTPDEIFFVDTGKILPKPLKKWMHRHRILRKINGSEIIDDITFSTGWILLDWLIFPLLYLQFWIRKPVYQRHFKSE